MRAAVAALALALVGVSSATSYAADSITLRFDLSQCEPLARNQPPVIFRVVDGKDPQPIQVPPAIPTNGGGNGVFQTNLQGPGSFNLVLDEKPRSNLGRQGEKVRLIRLEQPAKQARWIASIWGELGLRPQLYIARVRFRSTPNMSVTVKDSLKPIYGNSFGDTLEISYCKTQPNDAAPPIESRSFAKRADGTDMRQPFEPAHVRRDEVPKPRPT